MSTCRHPAEAAGRTLSPSYADIREDEGGIRGRAARGRPKEAIEREPKRVGEMPGDRGMGTMSSLGLCGL